MALAAPCGDPLPLQQIQMESNGSANPAGLLWLRARWRIENMFKYAAAHNGIDALADYGWTSAPTPRAPAKSCFSRSAIV